MQPQPEEGHSRRQKFRGEVSTHKKEAELGSRSQRKKQQAFGEAV
jgi:hypothetical protein